jgi:small-conductance mechanosensitive channel
VSKYFSNVKKLSPSQKRPIIITLAGSIAMIFVVVITLEISHRQINPFITEQQKYILSLESLILVAFLVELFARLATLRSHVPQLVEHGANLRLIVRIIGYSIGSLCVISILASNPTLGISVGAIAGVVVAVATQNILGSILAAIVIVGTRIIKVGEEISIAATKGTVADIGLTHTILSVDEEVVFVPNTLIISSIIRRKKRIPGKDNTANDW